MNPYCPTCNVQVIRSMKQYKYRGEWFCDCKKDIDATLCWFDIVDGKTIYKDVVTNDPNECNCGSKVKDHVPNGPYCRGV